MSYPKLSKTPVKEEYIKLKGKKALLNGKVVEVSSRETRNQKGSYDRGLAWSESEWGCLIKGRVKNTFYASFDHGVTWHRCNKYEGGTRYALQMTRKGRIKLNSRLDKELAFEGIQKINRDWYGPGYRWRP